MSGAELIIYLNQALPETRTVLVTAACRERVGESYRCVGSIPSQAD